MSADPAPNPGERARPRTLLLGPLPGLRGSDTVRAALDLRDATSDDVARSLATNAADVILLDGSLPGPVLSGILQAAGRPGDGGRPAVLVLTEQGRRTHVEPHLIDHADDFVNAFLGEEVLLARVRTALRLRRVLEELSRKNAELERLNARVEGMARRMAEELRLASHVQRGLLPAPLSHPRVELAAEFIPMREIGGDYYDLVPLGPSRLALALGDVMGKGVPAALLAANLKACLRANLHDAEAVPEQLIGRVNHLFWDVTPKGLFASLFFGLFDFDAGVLEYVNAGHDHPFLVRPEGGVECLGQGGTVLGLMEDARYEQGRIALSPNDLLVFYSDGITDRANQAGELFGLERLKEAAVRSRRDGARLALYTLLGEVQGWSSGAPAEDDMTLMVARVQ